MNNVKTLQQRLKDVGFYDGEVDGDFGAKTLAAALKGLENDGMVGTPLTTGGPIIDVPIVDSSFFQIVRGKFGPLRQGQVEGFTNLLSAWAVSKLVDQRWFAYMLATAWHETATTCQPVTEYGSQSYLRAKAYWPYIGRGYVQLTWKANYEKYGIADHPEKALDPIVAAHVMFDGMTKGTFTGRKLADYFNDKKSDAVGARKIINGTDRAQLIAGYYDTFLKALQTPEIKPLT